MVFEEEKSRRPWSGAWPAPGIQDGDKYPLAVCTSLRQDDLIKGRSDQACSHVILVKWSLPRRERVLTSQSAGTRAASRHRTARLTPPQLPSPRLLPPPMPPST
jgi:hypothetical protein